MSGTAAADVARDSIPVTPPSPTIEFHSKFRPLAQEGGASPSVTPTPTIQNEQTIFNGSNNRSSSIAKSEPTGKDIMRPLESRDWEEIRSKHEALLREHSERVAGLDKKFDVFVNVSSMVNLGWYSSD
jgi:hypothetical protein